MDCFHYSKVSYELLVASIINCSLSMSCSRDIVNIYNISSNNNNNNVVAKFTDLNFFIMTVFIYRKDFEIKSQS
jgi:hypothetical protein